MSAGFVLWFTGLSGSGKSTLTAMVSAELRRRGVHVEALDGDEIRKNLSKGLGFSKEDRDTNIRRLGFVANLVARSGGCAITAAISPYRSLRDEVRRSSARFCEVYCECPLSVLTARDPKGLYEKALRGEIKNFTGVDDPYEAPERPELHLHTDRELPESSARRVVQRLEELGLVPRVGDGSALLIDDRSQLLPPHGGELTERALSGEAGLSERERANGLPSVVLDGEAEAWLSGFATGAFSPLTGFVGEKDWLRISCEARLERGIFWPAAPLLRLTPEQLAGLPSRCREVALLTREGRALATLRVSEIWKRSQGPETTAFLAGDVNVFQLPEWCDGVVSARSVRGQLLARQATSVAALILDTPPSLVDEYVARFALEQSDALLFLPTAQPRTAWPLVARLRSFQRLVEGYFASGKTLVAPTLASAAAHGTRATWLAAIVAQNYGASRLIAQLPSDDGTAPPAALKELGIEIVRREPAVLSRKLGQIVTMRTAPDAGEEPLAPETMETIDAMLASGLFRADVVDALR